MKLGMHIKVARNIIVSRPIMAVFNVTNACNERCKMCNIWKSESKPMPLDRIESLAESMARFGIGYVYLQGGEPLLRRDILDIVDIFIAKGIKPTLITNGILLDYDLATELARRTMNVSISIDSLNPVKYAELRGKDSLERVLSNINGLKDLLHTKRGTWAITTTITAMSRLEDIEKISQFAQEYGFMYAIRPYVYVSGVAGKKQDSLLHDNEQVPIFEHFYADARRSNFLASLVYEECMRYIKAKTLPHCDAMKYTIIVKENGVMFPCLELPDCEFELSEYRTARKKYKRRINSCSVNSPCYWNCSRTVGVLVRNRWRILANFPKIVRQMKRYGNYF